MLDHHRLGPLKIKVEQEVLVGLRRRVVQLVVGVCGRHEQNELGHVCGTHAAALIFLQIRHSRLTRPFRMRSIVFSSVNSCPR